MNMVITICEEYTPFDETAAKISAWYDRHTRDYVIQLLNKDWYQIGDAIRCPDRATKDSEVKYLKEKYRL